MDTGPDQFRRSRQEQRLAGAGGDAKTNEVSGCQITGHRASSFGGNADWEVAKYGAEQRHAVVHIGIGLSRAIGLARPNPPSIMAGSP